MKETLELSGWVGNMKREKMWSLLSGLEPAWRDTWRTNEKSALRESSKRVVRARMPKGVRAREITLGHVWGSEKWDICGVMKA